MMWQRGLWISAGVLLSFALPVDGLRAAVSRGEIASASVRAGPPGESGGATCAATEAATAAYLAEIETFRTEWGAVPAPPAGWDPEVEETRLRAAMDHFPSELAAVSCEFYPCVLAMILEDKPSRETLTEIFGVPNKAVGISTSRGRRELYTVVVAAIDLGGLDEDERRWVYRLRARLDDELGPDLERLLSAP